MLLANQPSATLRATLCTLKRHMIAATNTPFVTQASVLFLKLSNSLAVLHIDKSIMLFRFLFICCLANGTSCECTNKPANHRPGRMIMMASNGRSN
jgi:hypothetical protein